MGVRDSHQHERAMPFNRHLNAWPPVRDVDLFMSIEEIEFARLYKTNIFCGNFISISL